MMHLPNNLTADLLAFYDRAARALPFRLNPVPYHIWISEIMLQQTRMDTVIPYFNRFIQALPTIGDLAGVEEEELMKLWEGLGYYSRARNLKKAAQLIQTEFGGEMPSTYEELMKLPGIGPYTAGAISSIAFGRPVPAVDGNVMRVFSRILAYDGPVMTAPGRRYIHEAVSAVMSSERPGDFNQAVMELGATVCLPNGAPLCASCPLMVYCQAYQAGNPQDYPVLPEKKARKSEDHTVLLIYTGQGIEPAFLVETRPEEGLLAGLNQFPMIPGHLEESAVESWLKECGYTDFTIRQGKAARHIFSHIEWQMISYHVELLSSQVGEPKPGLRWIPGAQLDHIALPTAYRVFRKELAALLVR